MPEHRDEDIKKGAVESDKPNQHSDESLSGQLPHRTEDPRIKGQDSDFPEPGENPEHSGQKTGDRLSAVSVRPRSILQGSKKTDPSSASRSRDDKSNGSGRLSAISVRPRGIL